MGFSWHFHIDYKIKKSLTISEKGFRIYIKN